MDLEAMTLKHRGYRSPPDDEDLYEYRIGSFEMDDGTVYGFAARETADGVVADYVETDEDLITAIRHHKYDLEMTDRLPGLEDSHLKGYGEAIAHELSENEDNPQALLEPLDD